jgi:carboxylate-amine ligase
VTRTVGVEEEFLLVGSTDPLPVPAGEEVAETATRDSTAPSSSGQFEHELKREQAELGTDPCESLPELARQLQSRRAELSRSARRHGARLAALATSPLPYRPTPTPDRRYQRIEEVFGQVAAPQLTCGMHVHVSVGSEEEGVRVIDRIGPWLAPLLALSANSPFWQGEDTGYASYRSVVWGQWPTAGATEPFGDLAGYRRVRAQLISSGAALDDGMLYFDARLSARYPTVEIRVADVCPEVGDAVTVAALTRALVDTAAADAEQGRPLDGVRAELLRAAAWRAARWGVTSELVEPSSATLQPAWTVVDALVRHVSAALAEAGDTGVVDRGLSAIRTRGTGSELQRAAFAAAGSLSDVVNTVVARTTSVNPEAPPTPELEDERRAVDDDS